MSAIIRNTRLSVYRCTAPCSRTSAARIVSNALLHFGVGQRAIGRLERQPHRQADRAVRHALALIAIEEADADERRRHVAAGRLNGATNDFRRQGIGDDDREIADDERMPRQRPRRVARASCARAPERVEIQLGDEHAILTRQRRARRRPPASADRRRRPASPLAVATTDAAWPGTRNGSRAGSKPDGDAERLAQLLDDALDVEEVDLARARRTSARRLPRRSTRPRRLASRRVGGEPRADLEQPHVAPAVPPVVRDRVDQARQERRPQRVELGGQRDSRSSIESGRASPSGAKRAAPRLRFDEAERDRFGESGRGQHAAHELIARRRADRAAAPAAVTTGNVGSSLSKP